MEYEKMQLTQLQAEAVWITLVTVCGACEDDQEYFVRLAQEPQDDIRLEYRFQGDLGFGGKIYLTDPPKVTYYPEDETPERSRKAKSANELLATIRKLWI